MKDLSFRARLLLYIIPCVVVGLLAVGTIAYEQFTSVIETELSSSMFKTSEVTATNINTWLQGRLLETEVSAANSQAKAVNSNWSITDAMDAERFTYLHKTHKEYEDIYAADQKAEFHTILAVNPDKSLKMNIGNLKGRSYYESIMAGGPPHFSEPLISRTTNLATTFAVAPIHDEQGRPIGLVGSGITLKYIEDQVNSMKYGEKGFGLLIASDGLYIVHPDQSLVMKGKITDSNDASVRELGRQMLEKKSGIYQYQKNGEKYIAFYHPIPAANWTIAAVVAEAELFAPAAKLLIILAPIILLIIIIMVAIILYAAKKLVAPLKELSIFADQVATGDLTGSLELSSKDEIGMLAASLNKTVASLRGIVGDLTNASHDIGSFSGKLSDVTAESGRASESIAQTMQDVAQGAVKQAQDAGTATELARHLSETSVTVRNSCSSMAEQAEQSKRASDTGTAAVMEAVKSMELIASHNKQHVQDTNDLLKKSQEIGQIIGVITGIAEQTNLLALNAAIEAARAGEHGRGFAVVAEEVRKLAEQSAKAADQITQLINGVQNQVQTITTSIDNGSTQIARGVDIAKHAGENFKEIKSVFDIISTSVLDMTKAVENMASGVNQVLDAIQNVAAVTEETSASTEEVSAAAEQQTATMQQIASSARKLFEQAEKLNKIVENFKL